MWPRGFKRLKRANLPNWDSENAGERQRRIHEHVVDCSRHFNMAYVVCYIYLIYTAIIKHLPAALSHRYSSTFFLECTQNQVCV